jgi:hypothetical protein
MAKRDLRFRFLYRGIFLLMSVLLCFGRLSGGEVFIDKLPNQAFNPYTITTPVNPAKMASITASTDGDWNDVNTWLGGIVPTSADDVNIPIGIEVIISSAGAECNDITILGDLSITGTNSLSIYGAWTNNGTFNPNNSTVTFTGNNNSSIGGTGTNTFYNLTLNKGSSTKLSLAGSNNLTITNQLTLTNGNLDTIGNTVFLSNSNYSALTSTLGSITGNFRRSINTQGENYLFPMGDGTSLVTLQFNFASITTAGEITVTTSGSIPGGFALNSATSSGKIFISSNTVVFSTVSATYTPSVWESDQRVGLYNGFSWNYIQPPGPAASFSGWNSLNSAAFVLADCEPPTITLSNNPEICEESTLANLTYSSATGSPTEYSIDFSDASITDVPWTNLPASSINITLPGSLSAGTYAGTLKVRNAALCESNEYNISVDVDALPIAYVTGSATICSNGTATVSGASAANGTILWSHNGQGNIIGATTLTPTYTAVPADAGNLVTLTMTVTSNNSCGTAKATATFTIQVDPLPSASAGGSATICSNGTATVSGATAANGTIQWSHNGQGTITNGTFLTPTYSAHADDAGETVILTMTVTSNNSCGAATATATFSIVVLAIFPGTISADQTICYNGNPDIISSLTDATGSGPITYQWESSTDNNAWTPIASATNKTYDPPGGMTVATYYRRVATTTLNGVSCSEISNMVTIAVQQQISTNTISGEQTICEGVVPTELIGNEVAPGPGATISYQWQSSPNGSSSWTNIVGATSQNYQPGALNSDLFYRRIVTSTLNGISCQSTSNQITIFVNNITPGSILDYQEICLGATPVTITSTSAATGDGTISYIWQSSTEGASGTFTEISPAVTTPTYSPPTPSTTTWYRRVATSTLNGVSCSKYVTHELLVGVYDAGTITPSESDLNFCAGDNPGIISGSNQTNAYTSPSSFQSYYWQRSTEGPTTGFTTISGATGQNYDPPALTQTIWFRRVVRVKQKGNNFCETPSEPIQYNVYPVPTLAPINPISVCKGDPFTITALASNTNGVPTYTLRYISGTYPIGVEPVEQSNNTGIFTFLPLESPYSLIVGQQKFEVSITGGDAGLCTAKQEVIVNIFDIPTITITTNCATSNDGIITIFANLNNANFQGSNIGTIQYTYDNGATWVTNNTKTNLSLGTYYAGARNSASPNCMVIFDVTIGSQAVETTNYSVCQNHPVPADCHC